MCSARQIIESSRKSSLPLHGPRPLAASDITKVIRVESIVLSKKKNRMKPSTRPMSGDTITVDNNYTYCMSGKLQQAKTFLRLIRTDYLWKCFHLP